MLINVLIVHSDGSQELTQREIPDESTDANS